MDIKKKCCVIGGSHTACMFRNFNNTKYFESTDENWIDFIFLKNKEYYPYYEKNKLNSNLDVRLRSDEMKRYDAVFLSIGGNTHNAIGLWQSRVPFDFILKGYESLELQEDRKILSNYMVKDIVSFRLSKMVIPTIEIIAEFCKHSKLYFIEPPPPIPSLAHIMTCNGVKRQYDPELGITPAVIRYKLWKLTKGVILREMCYKLGIDYLEVPKAALDKDGYLAEKYWLKNNSTHANNMYGKLVIEQIKAIL